MAVTQMAEASIGELVERRLEMLDEPQGPKEAWRVGGPNEADWAARKLAKATRQLADVHAEAQRQRNEIMEAIASYLFPIDLYEKEESERLEREVGHWTAKLTEWHRDQLAEDDSLKSIKLIHATLRSRKQPDRWEFTEDEFLAWARSMIPEAVRTIEQIDKPSVKASLKGLARTDEGQVVNADGELVPGLVVLPGDTSFTIEQEVGQ